MILRLFVAFILALPLAAQQAERYALILEDSPLAELAPLRKEMRNAAAQDALRRIEVAQQSLRRELANRNIRVTGSVQTLANAVFVRATEEQARALGGLPGVKRVERLAPMRRHLDRAASLVRVQDAWNQIGGMANAGAGVKIAVIDTGIDQTHPAFQDDSLPDQPRKCSEQRGECAFTNRKVIAARSYVDMLAAADDPEVSRPDDLSPRDRVGHGTAAAMIAAGGQNRGPAAAITGMAPKAYLGNYKIFGSPGLNDFTFGDVMIKALEDAFNDGMDIATLSLGSPAVYGPRDQGATCGAASNEACDIRAQAVETAVRNGMTVVVSAGNDGDLGVQFPALNTIHTPGTAPSAITVGASTNSHVWVQSVRVPGAGVPGELQDIPALFGDGPRPDTPLTAPARDVTKLQNDGLACEALAQGSLNGTVALVQRGRCSFAIKVNNAQRAGAVAVIIYQVSGSNSPITPRGLAETGIPAVMIGNPEGESLKRFLETRADSPVTLDSALRALEASFDTVADFSSHGPSIGEMAIKPELVAVGTDLYTATQRFDPNGELYDARGYTAVDGTSFSAPMVAGVVAMVKQRNSRFTPGQLKSAVVSTAARDNDLASEPVTGAGAGKLNAGAAVRANITVEPATLSFGVLTQERMTAGVRTLLRVTNHGTTPLILQTSVVRPQDSNARVVVPGNVTVNGGATQEVVANLEGTLPQPGSYQGAVTITGGQVPLRLPLLYLRGDGLPYNIFPLLGHDFEGVVNAPVPGRFIGFKLVDRYGVPVSGMPVTFQARIGGGSIVEGDPQTDSLGIAAARVVLGPQLGDQQFIAESGGLTVEFNGIARLRPAINTGGIVNAGSFQAGQKAAPGSYISIFGRGLSDTTRVFTTPYLPLSLAGVSVSFDVPSRRLSLPGRLHFVSEGQVNVQVPWELQGITTAVVKVSLGDFSSSLYDLQLDDYSPAAFEKPDPGTGQTIIAARHQDGEQVTMANPARPGESIQLYFNGLGPVDNTPPSGEPTPASPLARTRATPTVTIGGRTAQVQFSGLSPFSVGLYQINAVVPGDLPSGLQSLTVSIQGFSAKSANLPVR